MNDHATADQLRSMSSDLLSTLQSQHGLAHALSYRQYYGYGVARLPKFRLESSLRKHALESSTVQAEIVQVTSDISRENHSHQQTGACITILGKRSGFAEPKNAFVYRGGSWQPVKEGDVIDLPPGEEHGFTVRGTGSLHFLSVQSPPIVRQQDGVRHVDFQRS